VIVVENVTKSYGRFGRATRALDGVSLQVREGETLGLIGPNGAGKTTLLCCLLGFLRPDSGSVLVDGKEPDDLAVRARTGYMPERLGFDSDLTGTAFLAQHWRLSGGDPAAAPRETQAAAERVGLDPSVLRRRLRGYSRGMLQRIGVAQALLGDPALLFLDEPASGTDPNGVALVRERILEAKQRGATIVLNSHQLPEVERVCDRIVFLERGKITREESLRGEGAARRAILRVPSERIADAAAALTAGGFEPATAAGGTVHLEVASDARLAEAVRVLVLAGVPVFEVRSTADLESLFRGGPPS
jgi:ABC-2 type transport system ATP-binding protein